ncbi:MAG: dephospho-CoA kinase [Lachnospiraceae bacterium]|nr:dephospho-CoA kinase [Lachnospiraceae bacterium]
MKVLGITGGVGSGKSVVLSIMEEKFNTQNILTDLVAHDLMQPGEKSYVGIVEAFGEGILNEDKTINRKALGAIVFSDEEKLNQLNAITHPNVKEEVKRRIAKIKEEGKASAICLEAALLIETGYEDVYDELWYIYVNKEKRYERLAEGRGYSREQTDSIMKNQLSEEEFRAHADVIIDNSYTVEETEAQIRKVFG